MNKPDYNNIPKGDISVLDERGTYWILQEDQVLCLASPRRHDMLDRLCAARGPLSVRELANDVGLQPSALYHHLKMLMAVGLVSEAGTRVVNRKAEKLYTSIARHIRMAGAFLKPALKGAILRAGSALCRQIERDLINGHSHHNRKLFGPERNLGGFRVVGTPNDRTLAKINDHLNEVTRLLLDERDPNAPLVALAWLLAPLGGTKSTEADEQDG